MLSKQQRAFVEHYLRCWNAAQAARKAGYSERSVYNQAYRLMRNDEVKALIEARLQELQMGADEVLVRLTEQARGLGAKYVEHNGIVNLTKIVADGNEHLIKGVKWLKDGTMNVELYDAQSALDKVAKIRGMYQPEQEPPEVHVHIEGFADVLKKAYGSKDGDEEGAA